MNFFRLIATLIAGIIGCGIGAWIYTSLIAKKDKPRCNEDGSIPAKKFEIEYDPEARYFVKDTPAHRYYNRSCTYVQHLEATIDLSPERCPSFIYTLRDQDASMLRLKDDLIHAFRKSGFKDVFNFEEMINPVFAAYDQNRNDVIGTMSVAYLDAMDGSYSDRSKIFKDIVRDNERIIASLTELLQSINDYNAKVYEDETTDHITDFTGVSQLEKFNQTIKARFMTLLGTNQPLMEHGCSATTTDTAPCARRVDAS